MTKRAISTLSLLLAFAVALPATAQRRDQYPWQDMQQHAFDVTAGGTLHVRLNDADVAVVPATGSQARVDIRLRSNDMEWATERFERTNYRARIDGDTVVVESDRGRDNNWRSGRWMSVFVEVRVPARFDLDVMTQDGDLSVGSFEGNATLRTQDGDIRIGTAAAPEIDLRSSDGDISVAISHDARMELQTHDGDISIAAPESLRADIDFAGEEVYVRGDFSLRGNVSEGRAEGTINGGGERIRARTGDGQVRLIFRGSR